MRNAVLTATLWVYTLYNALLVTAAINQQDIDNCVCSIRQPNPFVCPLPAIDDHACIPAFLSDPIDLVKEGDDLLHPVSVSLPIPSSSSLLSTSSSPLSFIEGRAGDSLTFTPGDEPLPTVKSIERELQAETISSDATLSEMLSEGLPSFSPSSFSYSSSSSSLSSPEIGIATENGNNSAGERPRFLFFSEWRKRALALMGQEEDTRRQRTQKRRVADPRDQFLDSIDGAGDIGAIFESSDPSSATSDYHESDDQQLINQKNTSPPQKQLRHAVVSDVEKLLEETRERLNYASFDCGAVVVGANKEAKGARAILTEDKDRYMLNKCSAQKYVVVELCDEILIDTVMLANFEFFSSIFKDMKISVSDRNPHRADVWRLLGYFQARNAREIQVFNVENPPIWARYIRIDFLTHYGKEHYCPLTLLRVYGSSQMERYKKEEEEFRIASQLSTRIQEQANAGVQQPEEDAEWLPSSFKIVSTSSIRHSERVEPASRSIPVSMESEKGVKAEAQTPQVETLPITSSVLTELRESLNSKKWFGPDRKAEETPEMPSLSKNTEPMVSSSTGVESTLEATENVDSVESITTPLPEVHPLPSETLATTATASTDMDVSSNGTISSEEDHETKPTSLSRSPEVASPSLDDNSLASSTLQAQASLSQSQQPQPSQQASHQQIPQQQPIKQEPLQFAGTGPQFGASAPGTQESIYKNIMKRLSVLELNATLSQQYLEEQSKMLYEVLAKMENSHTQQLRLLVGHFNDTAIKRIEFLKRKYEHLWQATILEMETNRERTRMEINELTSKLLLMADEVIFEKRLNFVQLFLLLVILMFMVFSRGSLNALLPMLAMANLNLNGYPGRRGAMRWRKRGGSDTVDAGEGVGGVSMRRVASSVELRGGVDKEEEKEKARDEEKGKAAVEDEKLSAEEGPKKDSDDRERVEISEALDLYTTRKKEDLDSPILSEHENSLLNDNQVLHNYVPESTGDYLIEHIDPDETLREITLPTMGSEYPMSGEDPAPADLISPRRASFPEYRLVPDSPEPNSIERRSSDVGWSGNHDHTVAGEEKANNQNAVVPD
ncbi:uncharacterized protein VTP21DRAFT_236 [Calcarisporiella thermophila]|uniref:uncharacterized protein n=1 Tax=Calcarisporiella thermophila TaxID=911321 RepID=UPI003743D722